MTALGIKHVLYLAGRSELSVNADAVSSYSALKKAGAFPGAASDMHRARLMLKGQYTLSKSDRVPVHGSLELVTRVDRSDAQESSGLEIAPGLEFRNTAMGLHVRTRGRLFVAESESRTENREEWGAGVSASFDPGVRDEGLNVKLESGWGASQSQASEIWDDGMAGRPTGFADSRREFADIEFSYRAGWLGGRARVEPFGEFGFEGTAIDELRVGMRLRIGDMGTRYGRSPLLDNTEIEFFTEREGLRTSRPEHNLGLEVKINF